MFFSMAHPRALTLALLLAVFAAPLRGGAEEADEQEKGPANRVSSSLEWWVGQDGTATKHYEVSYEGAEILKRLDEFAAGFPSRLAYVENFLPFIEDTDRLVEKTELSRGRYRFVYRSTRKQDTRPDAKPSLIVWAPVLDDPLTVPWRSEGDSRYRYRFIDVEITSRVAVRGPWRFPAGVSHGDTTFSEPGIEARLLARELNVPDKRLRHPGYDLDGMELKAVVRTEPYALEAQDFEKLRERLGTWARHRLAGAALVGYPGDNGRSEADFGGGTEFGYRSLGTGDLSFGGLDIGIQAYYRRSYSRYFAWRMASLRLDFHFGSEPEEVRRHEDDGFFSFGSGISSVVEFRLPSYSTEGEGAKVLSFFELYAGPGAQFATFARDTVEDTATSLDPEITAGIRWGFSNPNGAFLGTGALGFRYTGYLGEGRLFEHSWAITLESLL